MKSWPLPLLICGTILIAVCADSKGKKTYIENLENDIFSQTVTRALQAGNTIQILDQNGAVRPVALKDFTGAGQINGIDLNNDGVMDIRITAFSLTRLTSRSFTAPADIDLDGVPDYFVYFVVSGNSVRISFLIANSAAARELVFIIDNNSQVTGIDNNGDGVSDDARLNGTQVVAPTLVNTPVYSPAAGAFTAAQNVTLATTTVGAALCYTTDGVTTPVCNAAKNGCTTGTLYASAINISTDQTLRAIGCLAGKDDSLAAVASFIIDGTAPMIAAAPSSGIFVKPQAVMLTGSATTGQGALNGSLSVSQICYTWGADASGNPQAGTVPADPTFPCTATNNKVLVQSSLTQLNMGCATRTNVTDGSDPNACSFIPGIYHLKFIAMDAAGNTTSVQSQSYAVGGTPTITNVTAPKPHLWAVNNNWGQSGDAPTAAGMTTRASTTWTWSADMDGTYTIRINDASGDCTGGSVSTGAFSSGSTTASANVNSVIQASDLNIDANDIKVCFTPSGGSAVSQSQTVWRLLPLDISTTYAKVNFNVNESVTLALADIFTPTNAIKTITFLCPAGASGADANNGCAQPTPSGSFLRAQGSGSVPVHTTYDITVSPINRVTTMVYDVRITLCDNAGCAGTAGPTFGTETAGPYSAAGTVKLFIVKDKTPGQSIFVATTGSDANPGTDRALPKRTLSAAMTAAAGGKSVYIAAGNYCSTGANYPCTAPGGGTLTVPSGSSVFGGFTSAWFRPNVSSNQAVIDGGSNNSADSIGITLGAVNTPVAIEGLNLTTRRVVPDLTSGYQSIGIKAASGTSTLTLYKNSINAEGANTTSAGIAPGGAYGLHIANINSVIIDTNTITGGNGWYGQGGGLGGVNGDPGNNGTNGTPGIAGCSSCCNDSTTHAPGGTGGTGALGAFNRGGNGGAGGWQNDGSAPANGGQLGGYDGENAPNGGGSGGSGADGTLVMSPPNAGGSGSPGPSGIAGTNGPAAGANYGQINGGFLASYSGSTGGDGTDGKGGGGGGGGGGASANLNDGGSGGGGGGGGGSKGTGGEGGQGGGATIAVFLSSITTITLTGNTMTRGTGGNGGDGKAGGTAGVFGSGVAGGPQVDDGGAGGQGGNGGAGGDGGHGSGGNGGSSFGLVIYPNITPTCSGNIYAGGGGGTGGSSSGNPGVSGANMNCFRFTSTTSGASCTCN